MKVYPNENIESVVLAAGYSSRAPQFKMCLSVGEKTIIERTIESMKTVCEKIIVVTGYKKNLLENKLVNMPRVVTVYNDDYDAGMFSSVQKGVSKIEGDRFFLIPGDQPLVKRHTLEQMLKIDADVVSPRCKGKKGHPVLFKNHLKSDILEMPKNSILRDFIHNIGDLCIDVEDMGIHYDVDTEKDYERIKRFFNEEYL